MKSILLLVVLSSVSLVNSQILKKTYHDWNNTRVKYMYYVNSRGEYNGLLTQYTYDGAKLGEETWVNGVKNGPYKEYFTRGSASKLKVTGNYKDDNKHGHWITYTYVKYGQSYFDIMQSMAFNDKEADIFNTGVQTKYAEEFFDNGQINKEIKYYPSGKMAYSRNYRNSLCFGEYLGYTPENQLVIKGLVGDKGKMIGTWIIPREINGDCPKDKSDLSKVSYTQKIQFDNFGNIDTNYYSKTYYLSGKLRDSVRVLSIKYQGAFDYKGIWYLCGPNTSITGSYRSFYESGKIETEGFYSIENGISVKSGIWKNYDQNGNLTKEVNEDESRLKAAEAKKETEQIEKQRIEKERIANEEKVAKENKEKEELKALIEKADSCIRLERELYHAYSISHKNTNPMGLDDQFDFIHKSFEYNVYNLQNQISKNNAIGPEQKKQLYSQIIDLGAIHTKANKKMIDYENFKVSYWETLKHSWGIGKYRKLEVDLKNAKSVEEKIKVFDTFKLESN